MAETMSRELDRYLDEPGIAAKAGVIATRLGVGLPRAISRKDALLQRALVYAAVAEQRLASQAEHLAYLESLTVTDDLTGLLNRRGFMKALEQALAQSRRFGETGMVFYVDLDSFKSVNDRLGHTAGDHVLREVARIVSATIREVDVAARIGGDEFAVALARIGRRDGFKRAEILQGRLNQARASWAGQPVSICATVGAAPFSAADSPLDVIARADAAMYEMKRRKMGSAAAAE
jgi:diguanylate cyclase (GGDEF)-like protein